jgi:1-acyl-sn-glycerol-3-phosphate acyltransferase
MKIVFMFRSLLSTFIFIPFTVVFSILGILLNITFNKKEYDDWVIATWANVACWLFNVKVKAHNIQKIPQEGCLFLFNHSSFFDIFAICSIIPDVRFGAKSELFSIPFFGYAMKRAGTLPIARGNREEVFNVYRQAIPRIKNNEKFALSAEGGRFYGEDLAPFKAGPIVFALSAHAKIVPLVITGAYETLPKTSFLANAQQWRSEIHIYFLEAHLVNHLQLEDRQELQQKIYRQMNSVWKTGVNPHAQNDSE